MRFGTTLKSLFLARSRREKVLTVLFIAAIAVLWFTNFRGRVSAAMQKRGDLTTLDAVQRQWLDNRSDIEARYNQAMDQIKATKLPDKNQFLAEVGSLLHELNVGSYRIDTPQAQTRPPLTFNRINVNIDKTDLGTLIALTEKIKSDLPYAGLEQLILVPDRRDPHELGARMRLVAIEFSR